MSYENPTQVIDTQSAQHLANLQNTISGTFQGVAKTYKAEQEARTKKLNEQAEIITNIKKSNQIVEDNLRNKMSEFGAQNPSLNSDAWLGAVDRVNDIKNTIDLGTASPKEIAALRQELSEIMALPTLGRTMLEDLTQSVVGFNKVLDNAGEMGGADLYGGSTMIKDLMVWQNLSPGERKQLIQKNPKNGKWEASIVIDGNQYTSEQLSKLTATGNGLIAIVSDQTSNFDNYTNMVRPKDEKTGEAKFNEGVLSSIKKRNINGYTESYQVVNKEFVTAKANTEIDAAIKVMSDSEKAVFYNNRLTQKGAGNKIIGKSMSPEDFDDPENQKLFKDAYTDKWFNSQIGKEVILSKEKIKTITPSGLTQGDITRSEKERDSIAEAENVLQLVNSQMSLPEILSEAGLNFEKTTKEGGDVSDSNPVNGYTVTSGKMEYTWKNSDSERKKAEKILKAKGYSVGKVKSLLDNIEKEKKAKDKKQMSRMGPVSNEQWNNSLVEGVKLTAEDLIKKYSN